MKKFILASFVFPFLFLAANAQIITTIAGTGTMGYSGDNGPAIHAELHSPKGSALDKYGNIYIADDANNRVRKVTTAGIITTIAGNGYLAGISGGYSGDFGPATSAELYNPSSVAVDTTGNIFIADWSNNRVRKVSTDGIITTYAGSATGGFGGDNGPATLAKLEQPFGVALDKYGNLYIAELENNRVRKVTTSGIILTIAGNGATVDSGDGGLATAAGLYRPSSLVVDSMSNLYICDYSSIRKVDTSGIITTIAGSSVSGFSGDDGTATSALLYGPAGLALDHFGNLYIADASGIISTLVGGGTTGLGDGGLAKLAELNTPYGVAVDSGGNIYIGDEVNERIRFVTSTIFVNTVLENAIDFQVFPNPSSGKFTVNLTTGNSEAVEVSILSITGSRIKHFATNTDQQLEIILDDTPAGIYYVVATISQRILNKQIIICK